MLIETKSGRTGQHSGIVKKKSTGNSDKEPLFNLISEIVKTREVRTTISSAVTEILNVWAGSSIAKKTVSGAIGRNIQKSMSRPKDISAEDELSKLFRNPDQIVNLASQLPRILDTLFNMGTVAGESLEKLPPADRKRILRDIISAVAGGRSGKTLTTWARMMATAHSDDPQFFVDAFKPGVTKWVEQTDFGELKDLLAGIYESSSAATKMINDVIWKYPAKVVLLLSFLPTVFNILIRIVNECVERFNNLAPDLVADVILSCFRDIDAENIGRSINELTELIRKIDTGSSLIGDSGVSGFNRELSEFLKKMTSSIDVKKLIRAREGIASGKEAVSAAFFDSLKKNPEMVIEAIRRSQVLYNPAIKSLGMKMNLIDELPEEDVAEAFSQTISGLDYNKIAEIINLSALLMNRLRNLKPALFPSVVSQVVDSLDLDECEEAVSGFLNEAGEMLKPIGQAVIPHFITTVCNWLMPDESHYEDAMQEARNSIDSLLRSKEVQQ